MSYRKRLRCALGGAIEAILRVYDPALISAIVILRVDCRISTVISPLAKVAGAGVQRITLVTPDCWVGLSRRFLAAFAFSPQDKHAA